MTNGGLSNRIGFQTLIYPDGMISQAFSEIGKAGYDGIEVFDKDFEVREGRITEKSAELVGELLKSNGIGLASMGVGFLEQEDNLGFMESACRTVSSLGGQNIFLLAPRPGRCSFDEFIELTKKLGVTAGRYGVTPSIHNHVGTICETLEETIHVLSSLQNENVGICFDNAHYMFYESDMNKVVRSIGNRITYVHFKDLRKAKEAYRVEDITMETASREFCDIGDGAADFHSLVRELKENGYKGWITVEIEKDVYGRATHLSKNFSRVNDLLKQES